MTTLSPLAGVVYFAAVMEQNILEFLLTVNLLLGENNRNFYVSSLELMKEIEITASC